VRLKIAEKSKRKEFNKRPKTFLEKLKGKIFKKKPKQQYSFRGQSGTLIK